MSPQRADQESYRAGEGIEKEKTRGAIYLLQGGTELHQRHHIEADVDQTAVQKHRRDESPPLMIEKNRRSIVHTQSVRTNGVEAPKDVQSACFPGLNREHQLYRKQEEVQAEKDCRDGRSHPRENGDFLGDGGEREAEAGATLVTASGGNADQSITGGTQFRAGLLVFAAEQAPQGVFQARNSPLPAIGKCQRASLQRACRVPIIPKLHSKLRRRGEIWTNSKRSAGV